MRYKDGETLPEATIWIDSNELLAQHAGQWQGSIALDTEFIRTDTFYPVPGLYQVGWTDQVYLLDPLQISDWSSFVEVLKNPQITKIMHACQEDLELIWHHLGISLVNVFDTQLANAFVSEDFSLSYAALVERLLNVSLPKHATRSNWLQRPLSDEQLTYAVEDVIYLPKLFQTLTDMLSERAERLSWFEQEMQPRVSYAPGVSSEYYRGLKKAWQLNASQLSALRSLCHWREDMAKSLNVPRNRVVWDDHLYQFAKAGELRHDSVHRALPRAIARKFADDLVDAHAQGLAQTPPSKLPAPLSPRQSAVVKQLRQLGRQRAAALGLAPELLSRKREVEECVRHYVHAGQMSELFLGWRAEAVGELFEPVFAAEYSGGGG